MRTHILITQPSFHRQFRNATHWRLRLRTFATFLDPQSMKLACGLSSQLSQRFSPSENCIINQR